MVLGATLLLLFPHFTARGALVGPMFETAQTPSQLSWLLLCVCHRDQLWALGLHLLPWGLLPVHSSLSTSNFSLLPQPVRIIL